jgi:hypothetical protein
MCHLYKYSLRTIYVRRFLIIFSHLLDHFDLAISSNPKDYNYWESIEASIRWNVTDLSVEWSYNCRHPGR